jgi:hypothetical protein
MNALDGLVNAITDILNGVRTGLPDTVINAISILVHEIQLVAIIKLILFGVGFVVACIVGKKSLDKLGCDSENEEGYAGLAFVMVMAAIGCSILFLWNLSPAVAPHLELINTLKGMK